MAEDTEIDAVRVEIMLAASPMLERHYLAGGGSARDLRTDMTAALLAATVPEEARKVIDLVGRPREPYPGEERRTVERRTRF